MKGLLRCAVLGLGCAVFVLMGTQTASAGPITTHADVNGLTTFEETSNGNIWVKLDNFYEKSYNEMKTVVEAAGFTVASSSETWNLLNKLPLDSNSRPNFDQWHSYASIMGSSPDRALLWGAFLPSNDPVMAGYAFAYEPYVAWDSYTDLIGVDETYDTLDMGIFAFIPGQVTATPEPATIASAVLGGLGLVALRRRNRSAR